MTPDEIKNLVNDAVNSAVSKAPAALTEERVKDIVTQTAQAVLNAATPPPPVQKKPATEKRESAPEEEEADDLNGELETLRAENKRLKEEQGRKQTTESGTGNAGNDSTESGKDKKSNVFDMLASKVNRGAK